MGVLHQQRRKNILGKITLMLSSFSLIIYSSGFILILDIIIIITLLSNCGITIWESNLFFLCWTNKKWLKRLTFWKDFFFEMLRFWHYHVCAYTTKLSMLALFNLKFGLYFTFQHDFMVKYVNDWFDENHSLS